MSEKAIRELRRRFILISFLSLLGAMMVIGVLMYVINYSMTQRSIRNTLDLIVDSRGLINGAKAATNSTGSNPADWDYTVNRFLDEIFNTSD